MKLQCAVQRRNIAHLAVTGEEPACGSSLELHLQHCPECRAVFTQCRSICAILTGESKFPAALPGFNERLAARIAMQPRSIARPNAVFRSLLGAAAVVIAVAVIFNHANRTIAVEAAPTPSPIIVTEPTLTAAQPTGETRHFLPREAANPAAGLTNDDRPRIRLVHHIRRGNRALHGSAPYGLSRTHDIRVVQTLPMETIGAICMVSGDYQDAQEAYGAAYQDHGDPNLAYSAGECAEQAGDMASAMDYYADLLSSPMDGTQPSAKGLQ